MRIGVFGCGYVGLVTAACLAEVGNDVIGVDVDPQRVADLNEAIIPIYEPGLAAMVKSNRHAGRLRFSLSAVECVADSEVIFIAVGTPPAVDGRCDLSAIESVATDIAACLSENSTEHKLVVVKSTVPVGTTMRVKQIIQKALGDQPISFEIAFNPEFLKEGAALADFQRPDRIVIGVENQTAEKQLRTLYAPYNRNHEKLIVMDIASAELTKYAANAMLATRISFMNEIAGIADQVDADIEQVRMGIGSDPRIGYAFLYAGAGFGGSCFPKDIDALMHTAASMDVNAAILEAVKTTNELQKKKVFEKLSNYFNGDLQGKTIALWGLSFKPETDDVREAPSRVLMQQLWAAGANVQAYDPQAMPAIEALYPKQLANGRLCLCQQAYDVLNNADALAVVTEWKSFWSPDFQRIYEQLNHPVVVDGRNIYDSEPLTRVGLQHYAIGRGL